MPPQLSDQLLSVQDLAKQWLIRNPIVTGGGGGGGLTDAELRAAPVPISGTVSTGLVQALTDAQLRAAVVLIAGTVNTGLTQTNPLTDAQLRAAAVIITGTVTANTGLLQTNPLTRTQLDSATVAGTDTYVNGQALADQIPGGTVVTFTFGAAQQLIWVKATGGNCRVDPFGGVPSSSVGIPCDDGIPNPLTIQTTTLKVFAPVGVSVAVWGYRY